MLRLIKLKLGECKKLKINVKTLMSDLIYNTLIFNFTGST